MNADTATAIGVIAVAAGALVWSVYVRQRLWQRGQDAAAMEALEQIAAELQLRNDVRAAFIYRQRATVAWPECLPDSRAELIIRATLCELQGNRSDATFWNTVVAAHDIDTRDYDTLRNETS